MSGEGNRNELGGLSDADKGDIASVIDAMKDATMAGDIEALRGMYTHDAVQMIPDQAEPIRGLSNFIFNDSIPLSYDFEIEDIDGSGDHAWMRGTICQNYPNGSDKIATFGASFLLTLRRQVTGTWLITTDTFTFERIDSKEKTSPNS
jgi:ketosteroid isomerase-like protein|tara:strand:+ start:4641 stop:5084 length:444 start_codon:yes stop_codon:yes gene_type:complete